MSIKKIQTALSLIELAEKNLNTAKGLLLEFTDEKGMAIDPSSIVTTPGVRSRDESDAMEVVEGNFDGENMVGDNGQVYPVPQNYASKTQLVVGDRMKWILTDRGEKFKLIQPVDRERASGTFSIEGDNYYVLINTVPNPVRILKASATYAIKNLGLKVGDEVAVYIPKDVTPTWGAFISVVSKSEINKKSTSTGSVKAVASELDSLHEFDLGDSSKPAAVSSKPTSEEIENAVSDFF